MEARNIRFKILPRKTVARDPPEFHAIRIIREYMPTTVKNNPLESRTIEDSR